VRDHLGDLQLGERELLLLALLGGVGRALLPSATGCPLSQPRGPLPGLSHGAVFLTSLRAVRPGKCSPFHKFCSAKRHCSRLGHCAGILLIALYRILTAIYSVGYGYRLASARPLAFGWKPCGATVEAWHGQGGIVAKRSAR
jgi:hypothetical protein